MYGLEISRILINKKLRQASIAKNESWLFNPYAPIHTFRQMAVF